MASRTGSWRPSRSSRVSSASKTRDCAGWSRSMTGGAVAGASSGRRLPSPARLAGARAASTPAPALGEEAREPGPRGRAELVEHRVAVAREGSQRGDDGGVGELVIPEGDALSADDAGLSRERSALQLLQEPRLAYARFTRDECERRPAGGSVGQRRFQLRELSAAADEPAARHARGHGSSIARHRR